MCSRLRNIRQFTDIALKLNVARINAEFSPNVAPTEMTPVIVGEQKTKDGQKVQLYARLGRFGITHKVRDKPTLLINIRRDSVKRGAFSKWVDEQRCIIPAEGFYEWREEQGKKQPYFFHRTDGEAILFAGIYEYSEVKGDQILSFAILTDEPNELIAPYHDRMPVAVENANDWLDDSNSRAEESLKLLGPDMFAVRKVSRAVNKVSEKDLSKIEAADAGQASLF